MIVAIVAVPYSTLSTHKKSWSHTHIFFGAYQLKPLSSMSFNLLVTPSVWLPWVTSAVNRQWRFRIVKAITDDWNAYGARVLGNRQIVTTKLGHYRRLMWLPWVTSAVNRQWRFRIVKAITDNWSAYGVKVLGNRQIVNTNFGVLRVFYDSDHCLTSPAWRTSSL